MSTGNHKKTKKQSQSAFSWLSYDRLTSIPEKVQNLWHILIGSYWFIPTSFVLLGIFLAPTLVYIDHQFKSETLNNLSFIFIGGADAARSITSAVAGAVLGVAGTTFSITIAVLSMASSQFGPRLLRNFLSDTSNQLVLGVFIGTFTYSLLVLKSIRNSDTALGVPQLSVTLSIILAIVCALLLVYFIQHTVQSIQASYVIRNASLTAVSTIQHWFSDQCPLNQPDAYESKLMDTWKRTPITPSSHGYIKQFYLDDLIHLAYDYGGVIELKVSLGDFVTDGNVIGYFYHRPNHDTFAKRALSVDTQSYPYLDGEFFNRLASAIIIGAKAVYSKDIGYSLGQLTEIAVRALSPGTNDPKTAINCIQALTICFSEMLRRQPPSPYHFYEPAHLDSPEYDDDKVNKSHQYVAPAVLALITSPPSLTDFLESSLGQVRRYAISDLSVLKALCQSLADLSMSTITDEQRNILLHQLEYVKNAGVENLAYNELIDDLVQTTEAVKTFITKPPHQREVFIMPRYQRKMGE